MSNNSELVNQMEGDYYIKEKGVYLMNKIENRVEEMNVQEKVNLVLAEITPLCCENRTTWSRSCCCFVCDECQKHYVNGSLANYCGVGCGWTRQQKGADYY